MGIVPGLDPLTLALIAGGTAASAGGAMINQNIQNDAIAAQNEQNRIAAQQANQAANQEQVRQRAYEEEQVAEVAEALTKANPAKALVRIRKEARASPVASDASYNATPKAPVENKGIERHAKKTEAAHGKRTDKITEALALLTQMGVDQAGVSDTIQQSGSDISTIGGFRRGSLDASGLETSIPAATVTPSDSMLGDLLMLGGGLAGGIGGTRMGGAGVNLADIFRRKPAATPPMFPAVQ